MAHAPPSATGIEAVPRLEGKNVLVTGGTSGIGRAIPVRFAQYRARAAISCLRQADGAINAEERVHASFEQFQPDYLGYSTINGAVQDPTSTLLRSRPRNRPSVRIPRTVNVCRAVSIAGQSRDHRDGMRDLVLGRLHHKLCGDRRLDPPDRPRLNQE